MLAHDGLRMTTKARHLIAWINMSLSDSEDLSRTPDAAVKNLQFWQTLPWSSLLHTCTQSVLSMRMSKKEDFLKKYFKFTLLPQNDLFLESGEEGGWGW